MWKIDTTLPILDIVAVFLSVVSILMSILIVTGVFNVHRHLNLEQQRIIKIQDQERERILKLLDTLENKWNQPLACTK
jgi:hypothetical protein